MKRLDLVHALAKLRTQRVFFGHQSVGGNILDGLRDLCASQPDSTLRIVETSNTEEFTQPVFGHAHIGENHNPLSKIDAFAAILRGGIGKRVDVAFFKLCYVDIKADTDVERVFAHYRKTMANLVTEFSDVHFVHCTVPVTVIPGWIPRAIRALLGKPRTRTLDDNLARNAYNQLLRKTYMANSPVFDIAAIESTAPSGRRNTFRACGQDLHGLVPSYSSDGRHLGPVGRRAVAAGMIEVLARLRTHESTHPVAA